MMDTVNDSYQVHGSIEPPRIIGRFVRLALGVICLDLVRQIVDDIRGMIERGWPVNPVAICTIILGYYLLRPVLNLETIVGLKFLCSLPHSLFKYTNEGNSSFMDYLNWE